MKRIKEKKWIRINECIEIYGLKKTYLYQKLNSDEIESKLISPKVRIISVRSIESFIDSK